MFPAVFLSVIVFLTFLPGLAGEFLNWDDSTHLFENMAVKNFDLARIFQQTVQSVYIPLTTLSFAVEYRFFGDHPFGYHLDNLILHALNTVLVYLLGMRLGLVPRAALMAALIFGIHPMKVESVSWVTERKDLMYAFFYLLSILQYLKFLECKQSKCYWVSIGMGFLSLLAKPMALSLPLVFLLLDWFRRRQFSLKTILEKWPLVVLFVPVVWMTFKLHVRNPIHNLGEAVLIWVWSFVFYLWKFFWPFDLIPVYHAPLPVQISHYPYLLSLVLWAGLLILFIYFRKKRWFVFSVLYYFCSIFFLLRFDLAKDINIVADRFMYLPGLGFCLLLGLGFDAMMNMAQANQNRNKYLILSVVGVLVVLLATKSIVQTQVWNNSVTLWTHVMRYSPTEFIAYNDRAVAFIFKDRNDLALVDYGSILRFDPGNVDAHFNRGLLRQKMGYHRQAIEDLTEVIRQYPKYEKACHFRGKSFEALGENEQAMADYNQTIRVNPAYTEVYLSQGNLLNQLGLFDEAVKIYLKLIEMEPRNPKALNNCATVYVKQFQDERALEQLNRAIELDSKYAEAYYNRSVVYRRKGLFSLALKDAVTSRQLGAEVPEEYLTELKSRGE